MHAVSDLIDRKKKKALFSNQPLRNADFDPEPI